MGHAFNEAYRAARFAVTGGIEPLGPVAASVRVCVSVVGHRLSPGEVPAGDCADRARADRKVASHLTRRSSSPSGSPRRAGRGSNPAPAPDVYNNLA